MNKLYKDTIKALIELGLNKKEAKKLAKNYIKENKKIDKQLLTH